MKIERKDLEKGQIELLIEVPAEEVKKYLSRAVEKLSNEVKIEGFRPGKASFEAMKLKIGELPIYEEAARFVINKTLGKVLEDEVKETIIGQPEVNITKLAPDNPLEYKVIVTKLPEVTLGQYKDLEMKQDKVKVDDEDVAKLLSELREMRVKEVISEEAVGENDKIVVDINMSIDNVPVEGGQAKDTAVVMGKGYVVPGFDKQLIGAKKGDERAFALHFPENHHQKNLAGKMVDFAVKIKDVYKRELPELDDQFAVGFGSRTVELLKEDIKKSIEKEKEQQAGQKIEIELLNKLIETSKFGDIPEQMVERETHTMMHELEHDVEHQGANFDDYLSSLKKSRAQIMLDMTPDAVKRVKSSLIIRQIAIDEKVTVEKEEIEEEIRHILSHYPNNPEVAERINSHDYYHYLENSMTNRKVIKKLHDWNVKK
ncbi:trigger factor [Candidatus Falkowbacteria bacterium]|nr:trigger factor [Candidatus Falkowbacteria bacterium]